jgi:hypothetical protein
MIDELAHHQQNLIVSRIPTLKARWDKLKERQNGADLHTFHARVEQRTHFHICLLVLSINHMQGESLDNVATWLPKFRTVR